MVNIVTGIDFVSTQKSFGFVLRAVVVAPHGTEGNFCRSKCDKNSQISFLRRAQPAFQVQPL
jgi:hypothetical protein